MFYLILSGLVILALVVSFTALKIRHDKYVGFILDNSVALKKLLEINKNIIFTLAETMMLKIHTIIIFFLIIYLAKII